MKTNILDKLKSYLHIAVIYAGDPSEPNVVQYKTHNPRYWKSYIDVATDIKISLENSGFSHVHLIREDKNLMQKLQYKKINFAWLNTAGVQGIDSSAHAACVLESLGIPYVGHTPANTMLMDNKHLFKLYLKSSGIKTAPHFLWHHVREEDTYQSRQLALFCKQFEKPEYHARFQEKTRFIVKPVCGRASQHVYIANTPAEVEPLCWRVSRHTNHYVMVELFLSGAEYCVAAMKPPRMHTDFSPPYEEDVCCFAHFERRLNGSDRIFTSMDTSPITSDSIRPLDEHTELYLHHLLSHIATKLYTSLDLYGLIRLDLRMDHAGHLHVLEANPKPDIKSPTEEKTSLVAMGLEQLHITYDELILNQLVNTIDHFQMWRPPLLTHFPV